MRQFKVWFAVVVGLVASVFALPALALDAAVTSALTTAFTNLQSDASAIQALAIPVVIGIMALVIVIRLIKRFMGST